jgi:hypothetical protein
MNRQHARLIALMLLLAQLGPACAAGPFDGEWKGFAASNRGPCKPAVVTLNVDESVVTGQARFEKDAPRINGTVHDDGSFGATIGWRPLTGKFTADKFAGAFSSGGCEWQMRLERAPK